MEMLASTRSRFVRGRAHVYPADPTSPSHSFLSGRNISPSLRCVTCKQLDSARCLFLSVPLVAASVRSVPRAAAGFLFPLVLGTGCSRRDAEQTNGPPFPKVTSCFPTHLQRHFPFPGLAGSSSLCQKGGRGRRCSSQSSQRERQRSASPGEGSRGAGSSWVR